MVRQLKTTKKEKIGEKCPPTKVYAINDLCTLLIEINCP